MMVHYSYPLNILFIKRLHPSTNIHNCIYMELFVKTSYRSISDKYHTQHWLLLMNMYAVANVISMILVLFSLQIVY